MEFVENWTGELCAKETNRTFKNIDDATGHYKRNLKYKNKSKVPSVLYCVEAGAPTLDCSRLVTHLKTQFDDAIDGDVMECDEDEDVEYVLNDDHKAALLQIAESIKEQVDAIFAQSGVMVDRPNWNKGVKFNREFLVDKRILSGLTSLGWDKDAAIDFILEQGEEVTEKVLTLSGVHKK